MVEIGRVGDTRQAIALTQRGADDYLLLIFAVVAGNRAGCLRIRCGRQQLKKKPPGRSPDGSFRNCRHGVGSIALTDFGGAAASKGRRQRSLIAG